MNLDNINLTARQKNEIQYHQDHAKQHLDILNKPFSFDIIYNPQRRWWIAYWEMYSFLLEQNLKGKKVLVVGCGFGQDALRLAKMGAEVEAFDLSPDSLAIARALAEKEGLSIGFREMPAEKLGYDSKYFDCVLARDILHHVDIPQTMQEIVRVSKNNALFVFDEIYSHSLTDRIRKSALVERKLYPLMQDYIYKGQKPYITQDERKLTETDITAITASLDSLLFKKYYNFLVTRLVPDKFEVLNKIDRASLIALGPAASLLAGRILGAGTIGAH